MIDPQLQANKWLKVNEAANKLAVIRFGDGHYLKVLETAVNCGYPVLLEDVEETLESSIDSLLEKKIQLVDGLKMTVLGDKKVAIDEKFYLYMTTRLANPKFLA
jgi:dynein heavy chain